MMNKKVFYRFLKEVKGVERQKRKYEKAARIERRGEPLIGQETAELLLMIVVCTLCFMFVFGGFILMTKL